MSLFNTLKRSVSNSLKRSFGNNTSIQTDSSIKNTGIQLVKGAAYCVSEKGGELLGRAVLPPAASIVTRGAMNYLYPVAANASFLQRTIHGFMVESVGLQAAQTVTPYAGAIGGVAGVVALEAGIQSAVCIKEVVKHSLKDNVIVIDAQKDEASNRAAIEMARKEQADYRFNQDGQVLTFLKSCVSQKGEVLLTMQDEDDSVLISKIAPF